MMKEAERAFQGKKVQAGTEGPQAQRLQPLALTVSWTEVPLGPKLGAPLSSP